jgi:hypothetical protein
MKKNQRSRHIRINGNADLEFDEEFEQVRALETFGRRSEGDEYVDFSRVIDNANRVPNE